MSLEFSVSELNNNLPSTRDIMPVQDWSVVQRRPQIFENSPSQFCAFSQNDWHQNWKKKITQSIFDFHSNRNEISNWNLKFIYVFFQINTSS